MFLKKSDNYHTCKVKFTWVNIYVYSIVYIIKNVIFVNILINIKFNYDLFYKTRFSR